MSLAAAHEQFCMMMIVVPTVIVVMLLELFGVALHLFPDVPESTARWYLYGCVSGILVLLAIGFMVTLFICHKREEADQRCKGEAFIADNGFVSAMDDGISVPDYYLEGWEMQDSWKGEADGTELRISTFQNPENPEEIWTAYQFETYLNYHFHGAIVGAWKSNDRDGQLNTFIADRAVMLWDIECALRTERWVREAHERGEERTEAEIEYENAVREDWDDDERWVDDEE